MSNQILWDCHMHSSFSADSDTSMEDMIREAICRGLTGICFTEHLDPDYPPTPDNEIFELDLDGYRETLFRLREKYQKELQIHFGIELGLQPHLNSYFHKLLKTMPFDFVIGSVHNVPYKKDAEGNILYTAPAAEKLFTDRTDKKAYRLMMETTLENVRTSDCFQTLGHLDYVVRYGKSREKEYSYTDYADIIDEILKLLIEKEKGLEVNSAGLKYGLPFAHPHPDVLKRYRELGGEIITIGADAHKPEHIAYDFAKAEEILKSCGFKYYTEFFEQKPVFKQLI